MPLFKTLIILIIAACSVQTAFAKHTAEPVQRLLVLGDSLAAGYGLPEGDAFPERLEQSLQRVGYNVLVINAGVSGDTSAGGLSRLEWALADNPDLVIVELGANDALRGLAPEVTSANLDAILGRLKAAGVCVILAGMRAPRNLGADYTAAFDRIYPQLAAKHDVPLYAFFLDGVVLEPSLNQADGIHPNAAGVGVIVERMLPLVESVLGRMCARPHCK